MSLVHRDGDALSLRVMRLNRPLFVRQQCESTELYSDDIAGSLTAADAGVRADLDGVALHRLSVRASLVPTTICADKERDDSQTAKDGLDLVRVKIGGPGELLSLPHSFGSTYLGETFSAYVNLHNESNQICRNVELKVALHDHIEWTTLFTSGTLTSTSVPALSFSSSDSGQRHISGTVDLLPGQSLNAVIHHELKVLGVHMLRCVASYSLAPSTNPSNTGTFSKGIGGPPTDSMYVMEPFKFQRQYKFTVSKPLDVKKDFSSVESDGSVVMNAQVQNLTSAPIYLERVVFEPSPNMTVVDLNHSEGTQNSLFTVGGQLQCLRPDDVRQFLYRLTPSPSSFTQLMLPSAPNKLHGTQPSTSAVGPQGQLRPLITSPLSSQALQPPPPISAGRLDITWRSTMGERGRLQTSSLKYEIPNWGDLHLTALELPSKVLTEEPFRVVFEMTNRSGNYLDLMLDLRTLGTSMPETSYRSTHTGKEDSSPSCAVDPVPTPLPPLVWLGLTSRRLGTLSPGRSISFSLTMMATAPGLQTVSGVLVHEVTVDRDYEFNNLGHVLVCSA
ncbi:hypothetical protein EG68_01384 [Paragonimus skrjabini miyazakii]|uniref:Trafficking protein particle complex subunit 13 n=1 Tax=Paragonimus skrjabini miyazakii TaxID=59628 RepID=A0A8S9ZAU1_9TREM|nr:hypothetical protein EG68_01384 [Paragonimus skrjabini miyazakii]